VGAPSSVLEGGAFDFSLTSSDALLDAAGQQIGTIDISRCASAPHTHIQRKVSGVFINFTMPCDNSHSDDPSGYYDDSDGTWP
jgi:hypothetical protein